MNKQVILLILCFLINSIINDVCDAKDIVFYKCSDVDIKNKCMVLDYKVVNDVKTTTTLLKNCDWSEKCETFNNPIGYHKYEYGICVTKKMIKFEGEKCIENSECYSDVCQKNKCTSLAKGQKCNFTNECKSGLLCLKDESNNKICQETAKPNEICNSIDQNCPIGYVCGQKVKDPFGDSTCLPMFSIEDGQYTTNRLLCKSGFAVDKADTAYTYSYSESLDLLNGDPICATAKLISSEKCTKADDCEYEITGFASSVKGSACTCSANGIDSYCNIATDHKIWIDWRTKYEAVLKDIDVTKLKNIQYAEMNGLGSGELKIAQSKLENYAMIQGGDECVVHYFTNANYYHASFVLISLLLFFIN